MNRTIYIILACIAIGFLGYTGYYITSSKEVAPVVATTTPEVLVTPVEDKDTYTTNTGKKITVKETNPTGESLSTLTITTSGFATNSPIVLEANKLTNKFYADINNDTFEELIITTMAQGSGGYGEAYIFITASNTSLLPVTVPEIAEKETGKNGIFEGYQGYDSFNIVNGALVREFPTYNKSDTNDTPTGPRRAVMYTLTEKNGVYSIMFVKATSTPIVPVSPTASMVSPSSSPSIVP